MNIATLIMRLIFIAIGFALKNAADKQGQDKTYIYPIISFVISPIIAGFVYIFRSASLKKSAAVNKKNVFEADAEEGNYAETNPDLITGSDFGDEYTEEVLAEDNGADEVDYAKFVDQSEYGEDVKVIYKEVERSDVPEGAKLVQVDQDQLEEIISNSEEPNRNQEIADKYKEILDRKIKKMDFLHEYYEKSDVTVLTKGRYESGKEKEALSILLLSRKEFLDKVQEKFSTFDEEKLTREVEIFNNFEAEIESARIRMFLWKHSYTLSTRKNPYQMSHTHKAVHGTNFTQHTS